MKLKQHLLDNKTRKHYRNIVRQLRRKTAFDLHAEINQVTIAQICDYLIANHKAGAYRAPTWRLYRAAINHVYGLGLGADSALKKLDDITGGGNKRKTARYGASQKMKSFPKHMFEAVMSQLAKGRRSKMTPMLQVWLVAGIETGLRPIEWRDAEWIAIDGTEYLKVKNGKASYDRGNGVYRHLDMSNVPEMTKRYIKGMINTIAAVRKEAELMADLENLSDVEREALIDERYKNFYDSARRKLRTTLVALFPDRRSYPSLYSLRHQFIANCKKDGMSKSEIAALCGQASAETAALHYGRRQVGEKGKVWVAPHPDEVKTVRVSEKEFSRNSIKEIEQGGDLEER